MVTTSKAGLPRPLPVRSEFIDVRTDQEHFADMNTMFRSGISKGWKTPKGQEYRPLEPIKRDAMAAFIYRALGSPSFTAPTVSPFVDVKANQEHYKEMCYVHSASNGAVSYKTAKDWEYRPLANIYRDEMAVFLYNLTPNRREPSINIQRFVDVNRTNKYYKEIQWMNESKVSTGWKVKTGAEYRPRTVVKRDAMGAFLTRWAKLHLGVGTPPPKGKVVPMRSSIANNKAGSITVDSLVAKRFTIGTSVKTLREVNTLGWREWLDRQFAMTDAVDQNWLKTYTDKYLLVANLPYVEAQERIKREWDPVGMTGVPISAGSAQRTGMTVLRHISSERQMNEAWTSFWLDHFSVPYINGGDEVSTFNIDLWMRDIALSSFPNILHAMMTTLKLNKFLNGDVNRKGEVNENLARELIELYTAGITTGVEEDIRQLARLLTGYSHSWDGLGNLTFFNQFHDYDTPTITVLGKVYKNSGIDYSNAFQEVISPLVLDLAWRDDTITFICKKILTHFITDNPSDSYVKALKRAYRLNDGSVKAIMEAMIEHPEFLTTAGSKWRTPQEMLATHQRNLEPVVNLSSPDGKAMPYYEHMVEYRKILSLAGHHPRSNYSPKGYNRKAETWMNVSSILQIFNAMSNTKGIDPKTYRETTTFSKVLGYEEGNYRETASTLVRELTGFTGDESTVSLIEGILSDKSRSWEDRINTAVARAYCSPYGFLA